MLNNYLYIVGVSGTGGIGKISVVPVINSIDRVRPGHVLDRAARPVGGGGGPMKLGPTTSPSISWPAGEKLP